jgi:hypothetical protein
MNGAAPRGYVDQVLGPTLESGDIVVMDILSVDKNARKHPRGDGRGQCTVTDPVRARWATVRGRSEPLQTSTHKTTPFTIPNRGGKHQSEKTLIEVAEIRRAWVCELAFRTRLGHGADLKLVAAMRPHRKVEPSATQPHITTRLMMPR